MIAALRQPTNASTTGLPSDVMKRALSGSDSIAVLGATSSSRHRRNIRRSVSINGPGGVKLIPGLRETIIDALSIVTSEGRYPDSRSLLRRRGTKACHVVKILKP